MQIVITKKMPIYLNYSLIFTINYENCGVLESFGASNNLRY